MESKNERTPPEQPQPAEQPLAPAPKTRFRIEKLEERIAPAKGSNNASTGRIDSGGSSGFSGASLTSGGY